MTAPIRFGMDSSTNGTDVVVGSADGWSSAVSSGDPIFCFVSYRHSTSAPIGRVTLPTGFTLIDSFIDTSGTTTVPGCVIGYKISDGTETSFTVSTSGTAFNTGVFIAAWSQTGLSTEINSLVTDLDSSLWLTTGTDITCGSATNTTADAVAIAVVFAETTGASWASGTWSNTFVEYQEDDWANAGLVMATKTLTSVASQSTLQEGTGTGTQLLSAMIIINSDSAPIEPTITKEAAEDINLLGGTPSSLTLQADTDLLLVLEAEDSSGTADYLQYNSVAMTQVTGARGAEEPTGCTAWYMLAEDLPATPGAYNIQSDQSGIAYIFQLSGVAQEAPQDSDNTNNLSTRVLTSKTLTVASENSLIFALGGTGASDPFADVSGQFMEFLTETAGNSSAVYTKAASSNTTISTDAGGVPARHVLSAIVVAPAALPSGVLSLIDGGLVGSNLIR